MVKDIRKLIEAQPFAPFTIFLADGAGLHVPTVDHVAIPPTEGRVFVFGDDDSYTVISPLLISRVNVDGRPRTKDAA